MELKISPQPYLITLILLLTQMIIFTKKFTKEIRTSTYLHQAGNIKKKKAVLIVMIFGTLISLIAYNSLGTFIGYKKSLLIYRSIYLDDISQIMIYMECMYETLIKSVMFFSLTIVIPLIYDKEPIIYTKFLVLYSFIRLLWYPLILIIFQNYSYLKMFVLEMFQISESVLLATFFIQICLIDRHVEKHNLIETYEYEYIFLRLKTKCKLITLQILLEILYRIPVLYLMISESSDKVWIMNLLYLLKTLYIQLMIYNVCNIIFCKEQETFDNLMNFTEVQREYKKEKKEIDHESNSLKIPFI
ncbi:hypothetical protein P3W45_000718 [Vairimorpha bombi]|jgi:hypothetical protein